MPVVLVQNPIIIDPEYDWKDILGEVYHFPNKYKNRCRTGTVFVYYQGTRRPAGKRAQPEYFGHGTIGEVWRDAQIPESSPKKDWAWYCRILDYVPFPTPVPAKLEGQYLERIAMNHWSEGVRTLPQETFDRILELAGCGAIAPAKPVTFPDLHAVTIKEATMPLLVSRAPSPASVLELEHSGNRYSRIALPVGRRAEEIIHRYLREHAAYLGAHDIRWIADEGSTPGWDLQYETEQGELIAVEVKGTTGRQFATVELTAGEWNAAGRLGDRYWLYLVAECCTTSPTIQRIQNPVQLVQSGLAVVVPILYRLASLRQQ